MTCTDISSPSTSLSSPTYPTRSWLLLDSFESLLSFLTSSLSVLSLPSSASSSKTPSPADKKARDSLLSSAKAFWAVSERAEKLPRDEVEATRGSWKDVLGMLGDCLEEMKEMGDAADKGGANEDEEEEEGERDEDDFSGGGGAAFTKEERERVNATYLLLRLTRLLINRLFTKTAPSSSSASSSSSTPIPGFSTPLFLSTAQRAIQRLSALGDDVAASLEPPQSELGEAVEELCEVADELAEAIGGAVKEGEEGEAVEEEKRKEREWVKVWRTQRDQARQKLEAI
jgi:hypothetical protein